MSESSYVTAASLVDMFVRSQLAVEGNTAMIPSVDSQHCQSYLSSCVAEQQS